jgi:hypothetical protein
MAETISERDWAATDGFLGSLLPPVRMRVANAVKTVAYKSGLHRVVFCRYD